jgi:hypothetical protein
VKYLVLNIYGWIRQDLDPKLGGKSDPNKRKNSVGSTTMIVSLLMNEGIHVSGVLSEQEKAGAGSLPHLLPL